MEAMGSPTIGIEDSPAEEEREESAVKIGIMRFQDEKFVLYPSAVGEKFNFTTFWSCESHGVAAGSTLGPLIMRSRWAAWRR